MTHTIIQIVVNAQQIEWNQKKISFKDIVKISFPQAKDKEFSLYTVTYHNWPKENPKGSMSLKDKVDVANQMIFTCTSTSQS
jgi:hypothetical protein